LSILICNYCCWAVGVGTLREIEKYNILQATLLAMAEAVNHLYLKIHRSYLLDSPLVILVDGNQSIPDRELRRVIHVDIEQHTIKGGDDIHKAIGAASIVAKVFRDREMKSLDVNYPGYGFAKHKGYGTEQHRRAIMELGVSPVHRKTFRGVYEYV